MSTAIKNFLIACVMLFLGVRNTLAQEQISEAENGNSIPQKVDSLIDSGEYFLNLTPDSAFVFAKHALDISEEVGFEKGVAMAKKLIGETFYWQGAYDQSIEYLLEAAEHYKNLNDLQGLAENHIALGIACQYALRLDVALDNFQQGLILFKELGIKRGMADAYGNLGHYYEKKGTYDSAFYYQHSALELYQSVEDVAGMAIIYGNLGSIHEDLGNMDDAYHYFLQSAKYDSLSHNKAALVISLNNIGDTYRKRGVYQQGMEFTTQALNLAKSLHLNYQIRSAYRDMAKTFVEMGRMDMAFVYMDSIYNLSETVFSTRIAGKLLTFKLCMTCARKRLKLPFWKASKS